MVTKTQTDDINRLVRFIVEHTHTKFGRDYFKVLVRHLSEALEVKGAWVTELLPKEQTLRSFAFWFNGGYVNHYEYSLTNTPCERVITDKACFLVAERVIELFPDDPDLEPLNAVSYMGQPLFGEDGDVLGHLAIIHDAPLHPSEEQEAVFSLFAQRANAELLRLKANEALFEKKKHLSALIENMNDAILEIDSLGFVSLTNPAASILFGLKESELSGSLVYSLFEEDSAAYLRGVLKASRTQPEGTVETGSNKELQVFNKNGDIVPVGASICRYQVSHELYHTLLLRNLKELRRAEQRIRILEDDASHLGLGDKNSTPILGECSALRKVLEDIQHVAKSNSTVLLLGESGTGKEVFARNIHERSLRSHKPLIIVNCAAIPSNLIESEFFGHEKGAFTGALQRREGRFSLADGGTLFLDEVGELPLDMQPKLLRVLQEGEFETLGGNRTVKVDVRVIAATNRNLHEMVKAGTFREDLYYRLNVIPIHLPSLREREGDVVLLADLFIKKFSRQTGKKILPLNAGSIALLLSYQWPGNIRELQHVIERAVILAKDENLQLERFIPSESLNVSPENEHGMIISDQKILTAHQLEALERKNLLNALEQTAWKISGKNGAASLLGIPPSTLSSKIKAFGLRRRSPN
ncbi:sigma-54 interaction domain-containing protein [Negadavirga shengliensis]|uniref:Sigma-54 interaction domain-containing protein n=1 Tax=Negadavirga shengliensis TaxID=1389218 RepID=A0ABV9SYQ0_9BACT